MFLEFCLLIHRDAPHRILELLISLLKCIPALCFHCLLSRRTLEKSKDIGHVDINCVDPLGRSALLMAIDNENLEMMELLIDYKVETKDALLHAIHEEYVEAVEVLLDHEETIHKEGTPHVRPLTFNVSIVNYEQCRKLLFQT